MDDLRCKSSKYLILRGLGLIGLLSLSVFAQPTIHTVNGGAGSRLNEAVGAIISKPGGNHIIEFAGYTDIGAFSLDGIAADSIIFRRKDASVSVLSFSSALFSIKNFSGTMVFRGLAFKASSKTSVLLSGAVLGEPNKNLLFDSCQILADTLTASPFLSWQGSANSKIVIRKSTLAIRSGSGNINLTADTVLFDHNLFQSSMSAIANVEKFISIQNNTFVRTQVSTLGLPQGSSVAVASIKNNIFLFASSGRPGPLNMLAMGEVNADSVKNNAKAATYSRWDQGQYSGEYTTGNGNVNFSGTSPDTTELWNWVIAGETTRGAYNPAAGATALPVYSLYPASTTLRKKLGRDSIAVVFDAAEIPRQVDAAFGNALYASTIDSLRSVYLKDTTLVISGPGTLRSVELSGIPTHGPSVLVGLNLGAIISQTRNPTPDLPVFLAPATIREFIPAFGGQNTFKGSNVTVKGLSADTVFVVESVSRAGRTGFSAPTLSSTNKRWRVIQKGGKPSGFKDTTTAEGAGNIRFGLSKTGADNPFSSDSLFWWHGGSSFSATTDSSGKYHGNLPFANTAQAVLIERLAVGKGGDTLILPQAKIISASAGGHQFKADSTYKPDQTQFPDMGSFSSKGLSFRWGGRAGTDSLFLVLTKTNPLQRAYLRDGAKATALTPAKEDSASVTLALGIGDSGKVIFLARKYSIPAGIPSNLNFGRDSVKTLISTKPGELSIDSTPIPNGLDLSNARLLGIRIIKMDSLQIQGTYSLSFDTKTPLRKDSVRALAYDGTGWKPIVKQGELFRYTVPIEQNILAVVILEGLPIQDLIPKQPAVPATSSLIGNALRVTPNLSADEKNSIKTFKVDVFSMDLTGKVVSVGSGYLPIDSSASLALIDNTITAYRVIYQSFADRLSLDTAWIILPEKQFSAASVQNLVPQRKAKFKYLIGFPFSGSYASHIEAGFATKSGKDSVSLDTLNKSGWAPINLTSNPMLRRGAGYMLAASVPYQLKVGTASLPTLKPDTLRFTESGWHLISNPFPFPIADANIKLDPTAVSLFQSLRRLDTAAKSEAKYTWDVADTLKPFEGYLVYLFKQAEIIFDPFHQPVGALKKAASKQALRLEISNDKERATMTWFAGNLYRTTPYFRPLNSGLELKPEGGYLFKPESDLDSILSEFEIHAARTGRVTISVVDIDGQRRVLPTDGGTDVRLVDRQSGRVYFKNELNAIEVEEGPNAFTILMGASASLDQQMNKLMAAMPQALYMGQNFPNPFFGTTQIHYQIPANIGRIQNARIDVFNLSGKIIQSLRLEGLRIGFHTVKLGKDNWKPGIYVAQLAVQTEKKTFLLKKKMIYGEMGL